MNSAGLSEATAAVLQSYRWPGNVRELRNVMERAAILCPPQSPVQPSHLPPLPAGPDGPAAHGTVTIHDAEQKLLEETLKSNGGNIQAAARQLGVSRGTLYRKIRKYGL